MALAAAALLAVPLAGTAAAEEGGTAGRPPWTAAAGTWSVRATGDDGDVVDTVMELRADGTVSNNVGGVGTWRATGPGAFVFRLDERVLDDRGDLVLRIEIEQRAVLSADRQGFTGSGTALTFDRRSTTTGEYAVRTEARRV
ncbi:hypothetical protein AC230_11325 [Streptomyces caatingaensis]|uniref:Htaa domain-containing protein n=1 Tax=Streptomyces caatingaensis TaxID=1678637 RepID=A0A0K9XFH0_9ACTN|nr:hypothetical protein AC230_11325 [Streptomyces caatingaensis]